MPSKSRDRGKLTPLFQPNVALVVAAIVFPAVLLGLAAWYSYREVLSDAESRVERTTRLLEEHALKVFETNRLVIQLVRTRLRFIDWSRESDRADFHTLLKRLQDELDQVSTITIVGADGRLRSSGRAYPVDTSISFADRDYFQALKTNDPTFPFVSRAYPGRQTGLPVFNLAERVPSDAARSFDGVIVVSVSRTYFEGFYKSFEPGLDHSVVLTRDDGEILASEPAVPMTHFPPDATLMASIKTSPDGDYTRRSRFDGVERIFSYRKIGTYPVYVRFGISRAAALAPWRAALMAYGFVAALASLALVAASGWAVRQTERERLARRRWEETAAALQTEAADKGRIEAQLRQSQKMEAVGRLTGGVAHDFNNLLTAVIGSLDLLRRRATGLDPKNVDLVANALEGAQRAASLTSRLLAFSRQQPLQPVQVETNRLVAGMSDLLRSTLGEPIVVETVLAGGLWKAYADPNQLESAILNLAVNARDAMPEGGKLTIETANAFLDEAYATAHPEVRAGQYVMIAVSDTGTGIAPDILPQIFDPFFTTKEVGKGTGLGLSQVYGFVKQSGGHAAVYSEMHQGTTFKLYLPRMTRELAPGLAVAAPGGRPGVGHGETVVVVEDESLVRLLSVAALGEAGYTVIEASDGPQALDLLKRHPETALLFTDVVLAGPMNGRTLADTILLERPNLPVLFTTGYTRNAIIHHGRLDDGVNFIGKPFTSAALVAKVHDLLATRDAGEAPDSKAISPGVGGDA